MDVFKRLTEEQVENLERLDEALEDMADNGMLPDHSMRTKAEIRAKMDELMKRPTGLNDQIADLYRGRVEGLRWVLGEIDQL